jgi:hypothetical protein
MHTTFLSKFLITNILNFDIYFPNYTQDIQRNACSSSSKMSVMFPFLIKTGMSKNPQYQVWWTSAQQMCGQKLNRCICATFHWECTTNANNIEVQVHTAV